MEEFITGLAIKARQSNPEAPGDQIGRDGILYCGVCGEPKEILLDGMKRACACKCSLNARSRADAEKQKARNEERRRMCFISPKLAECRIEKADSSRAAQLARRYISGWATAKEKNYGLLLWGNVGTGKTFLSACIANAVIDTGDSARMRTAGEVVLEAQDAESKAKYIGVLCDKGLLVLDDLGTERETAFGAEIIYTLIDKRYQSGKPLIVTTNIPLQDMKAEAEAGKSRVYDRILEICVPVKVDGESRRKAKAADRIKEARAFLEA